MNLEDRQDLDKIWAFNKYLLCNQKLNKEVAEKIQHYVDDNVSVGVTPLILWDALKPTLCGHLISLAAYMNRIRNKIRTDLLDKIAQLEQRHKKTGSTKTENLT